MASLSEPDLCRAIRDYASAAFVLENALFSRNQSRTAAESVALALASVQESVLPHVHCPYTVWDVYRTWFMAVYDALFQSALLVIFALLTLSAIYTITTALCSAVLRMSRHRLVPWSFLHPTPYAAVRSDV